MKWKFFCLGEFEVHLDGKPLTSQALGSGKARQLLKILLSRPNSYFSNSQLCDYLWGEDLPDNPSGALRNYIYQLRKLFEPDEKQRDSYLLIRTELNGSYGFFLSDDCWLDTVALMQAYKTAQNSFRLEQWQDIINCLLPATTLYRNEYLMNDSLEEWTFTIRDELQDIYSKILVQLAESFAHQENWLRAAEFAQKATKYEPGNEILHCQLMVYFSNAGHRDKSIQVFNSLKAHMKTVGADLSPQTIDLHKQVLDIGLNSDISFAKMLAFPEIEKSKAHILSSGKARQFITRLISTIVAVVAVTISFIWIFLNNQPKATISEPSVIKFIENRVSDFNEAGGFPPVMIDFEDLSAGDDLTGRTIQGVRFEKNDKSGASLLVSQGWESFTPGGYRCEPLGNSEEHKLFPTSGANILSPGGVELAPGPNPSLEDDDLVMIFDQPVSAVGFDILWQSADGSQRTIIIEDELGNVLRQETVRLELGVQGLAPPGGTAFVGFVSDKNNIAKVIVDEFDNDNCRENANAGYDTIRFQRKTPPKTIAQGYTFLEQWGGRTGENLGEFNSDSGPRGLAIAVEDSGSYIFVSDYVNRRIQKLDSQGRFIAQKSIGYPIQDIEYDGLGAFYVRAIDYLLKLDLSLEEIWRVEAPSKEWISYGLCIDSDGNVHVPIALSTAPMDHMIYKYDPIGNLLLRYGSGQVKGGGNCEGDGNGFIYATDGTWTNLRKFSNEGELQETIRLGFSIQAIAINRTENHIFLAFSMQGEETRIRKYNSEFKVLAEWGGHGKGSGLFSSQVRDLELDHLGQVYVNDGKNFLIQVFQAM